MDRKTFKYKDHPSITIVGKKPRLRIFEDFAIEENLPKYEVHVKPRPEATKVAKYDAASEGFDEMADSASSMARENMNAIDPVLGPTPDAVMTQAEARDMYELSRMLNGDGIRMSTRDSARWDRERYIRTKLNEIRNGGASGEKESKRNSFLSLFTRKKKEKPEIPEFDVEQAFGRMKEMFYVPTTELMEKHKKLVDIAIKRLKEAGQYAKADEVNRLAFVTANELTLAKDKRFAGYITEDQVVHLMLKSEKGINVEFLRYYRELLPPDVIIKKQEADKLLVFDNYAVIHYDKNLSQLERQLEQEEISKEREKRRDPILVGLIQGSRKLYYIADWVTPKDDLTLAKLEELTGTKSKVLPAFEQVINNAEENAARADEVLAFLEQATANIVDANAAVDGDDML